MPLLKQRVVGEHVRRLRARAGLSLRALAGATGFSPSFISQLEHGQVSPSIGSMEKITGALGVTLGEFFEAAAGGGEGGLVLRSRDRQGLASSWSRAEIEGLSAARSSARLEPVLITLKAGGRSGKHPYGLPREEFAFVLEGTLTLTLGPERHLLRKGDSATILPGELRMWENNSRRSARLLTVSAGQQNHGLKR